MTGPLPPRLAPVVPGALTAVDAAEVASGDDDLVEVAVGPLRLDSVSWTGRRRLEASSVTGLTAGRWEARSASVVGSVLDGLNVVTFAAGGSGWWQVAVRGSRVGSVELYDSTLRNVEFIGCKLGYLNLRDANLTDVAFTDCVIEEVELLRGTATRVAFEGTTIGRLELSGSKLSDFDLRGARLAAVGSLEGLRGATITSVQLLELAPAVAAGLGIRVE